jgi:hypothetical protein
MVFGIASTPVAAQMQARPALQPVAILTVISGDVLMRNPPRDFSAATDGAVLFVGTVLRTSQDAVALITLFEGSTVELDPASDVTIRDAPSGSTLAQAFGRGLQVVMHLTTADSRYEQTTPAATASVRGVAFEIDVARSLSALPTTLLPTARLVSSTVSIASTTQAVAPTQTTAERANTASPSTRSSTYRGDRIGKVLTEKVPSAPPDAKRTTAGR